MKVSLIVAQGVHAGKVIPIPVAQFVIGRDEACQLRPSSPAISKRHCAVLQTAGKVVIRDFGSTNGTFVNDVQVTGDAEIKDNDRLKVGPLEFTVRVEAGVLARSAQAVKPRPDAMNAPTPPPKEEPTKEEAAVNKGAPSEDDLAAMLLGTDDGPPGPLTESSIPSGSTIFEVPAMGGDPNKKPDEKKPAPPPEDNSKVAAAILRKYMQRPRAQ